LDELVEQPRRDDVPRRSARISPSARRSSLLRRIGAPAFVVGHSYGAHVALGAALAVPELLYEAPWPHL